jgi:hypothetical protein
MPSGSYNYGWVGLSSFTANTTGRIDAYNSTLGGYVSPGSEVSIYSNLLMTISGSTVVNGNANRGPAGVISVAGSALVSGDRIKLNSNFILGGMGAPGYNTNYLISGTGYTLVSGNLTINNGGTANLPAGYYVFNNITVNAGGTLNINANTTSPCYIFTTNMTMNGRQTNAGSTSLAQRSYCTYYLFTGVGTVTMNPQTGVFGIFYGPTHSLTVSGTGQLYGLGVFNTITLSSSAGLHHDTGLGAVFTSDSSNSPDMSWPPDPISAARSVLVK